MVMHLYWIGRCLVIFCFLKHLAAHDTVSFFVVDEESRDAFYRENKTRS